MYRVTISQVQTFNSNLYKCIFFIYSYCIYILVYIYSDLRIVFVHNLQHSKHLCVWATYTKHLESFLLCLSRYHDYEAHHTITWQQRSLRLSFTGIHWLVVRIHRNSFMDMIWYNYVPSIPHWLQYQTYLVPMMIWLTFKAQQ